MAPRPTANRPTATTSQHRRCGIGSPGLVDSNEARCDRRRDENQQSWINVATRKASPTGAPRSHRRRTKPIRGPAMALAAEAGYRRNSDRARRGLRTSPSWRPTRNAPVDGDGPPRAPNRRAPDGHLDVGPCRPEGLHRRSEGAPRGGRAHRPGHAHEPLGGHHEHWRRGPQRPRSPSLASGSPPASSWRPERAVERRTSQEKRRRPSRTCQSSRAEPRARDGERADPDRWCPTWPLALPFGVVGGIGPTLRVGRLDTWGPPASLPIFGQRSSRSLMPSRRISRCKEFGCNPKCAAARR